MYNLWVGDIGTSTVPRTGAFLKKPEDIDVKKMAGPVTQIVYLTIPASKDLKDAKSEAGKTWSDALDLLQEHAGFLRLYWGRSPEDIDKVQLHVSESVPFRMFFGKVSGRLADAIGCDIEKNAARIHVNWVFPVRDQLSQHYDFLNSTRYAPFKDMLERLTSSSVQPFVRHAYMQEFTPNCQALGKGAPFTGSAIYVGTDRAWHEGAWPLWTHIVRYVDGCLGCAGGQVVEPVDGFENSYIVYVGWETIEKHEAYHHTEHFAKRRIVLGLGNRGYREYGHIKFEGSREASVAKL